MIVEFLQGGEPFRDYMARLFALNMLVNSSEGGTYSQAEYDQWARAAGFVSCSEIKLPGPASALLFGKGGDRK